MLPVSGQEVEAKSSMIYKDTDTCMKVDLPSGANLPGK